MANANESKCKDCTFKQKLSATVWFCPHLVCVKDLMPVYRPKGKPPD